MPPAANLGPPPPTTADSNRAAMDDRKSAKGLILIFVYAVVAIGSFSTVAILSGKPRHGNSPWYHILLYLSMFTWAASCHLLVVSIVWKFKNNSIIAHKATTYVKKGSSFKSNSKVAPSAATPLFLSVDATPAATLSPPLTAIADSNQAAMDNRKSAEGLIRIFAYAVVAIGSLCTGFIVAGKPRHSNSRWYRILMYLSLFTWTASFTLLAVSLALRFRNSFIAAPKATTYVRKGSGFKSNFEVTSSAAATDVNEHCLVSDGH